MNKLLLLSILPMHPAFGTPCTTAVGNAHVFATCVLGDRTFSAFAAVAGNPRAFVGAGQDGINGTNVLVPFTRWTEPRNSDRAAATLEFLRPERTDRTFNISTAVTEARKRSQEISDNPLSIPIAAEPGGGATRVDERREELPIEETPFEELPIIVAPPEKNEEKAAGEAQRPVLSSDLAGPGLDEIPLTETPEPATYVSLGVGLIGCWVLGRRARRADSA